MKTVTRYHRFKKTLIRYSCIKQIYECKSEVIEQVSRNIYVFFKFSICNLIFPANVYSTGLVKLLS